jgi:serine acetyltransferase
MQIIFYGDSLAWQSFKVFNAFLSDWLTEISNSFLKNQQFQPEDGYAILYLISGHNRFPVFNAEMISSFNQKNIFDSIFWDEKHAFILISKSKLDSLHLSLESGVYQKLLSIIGKDMAPILLSGNTFEIPDNLLEIEHWIRGYQLSFWLNRQVQFESYSQFYIDKDSVIAQHSTVGAASVIKGKSKIGKESYIHAFSWLENAIVGDNCTILPGCVIRDSILENNVTIGPYAHLRAGTLIKNQAKVGNFVEIKKSVLGEGSKSMHLSYLGDAEIGSKVNIGAGTITCNYDGEKKHPTFIENNVFIGSGTELVAPIRVGMNAYVAAGSTITKDVPPFSLAIAREKQRNLADWAKRKIEKNKNK